MTAQYRGIAQLVEYRSPKPWVAGSNPPAPAKKSKSKDLDFFICAARHNIICVAHATSFRAKREHHCRPTAQMNEVAPLVQMMCFTTMWACAQRCPRFASWRQNRRFIEAARLLLHIRIANASLTKHEIRDIIISTNNHKTSELSAFLRYNVCYHPKRARKR